MFVEFLAALSLFNIIFFVLFFVCSSQTSPQGNVFAKTSRDMRKDSSLTGPGVDPPTVVPSSPKTTQVSPKLQLSPSPLSPNLSKHSPNPPHSPSHASPKPQASPRSSQVPCSPIPTPTPTAPEPEEASSVGVKVKVEKDISPPERTCSKVKKVLYFSFSFFIHYCQR